MTVYIRDVRVICTAPEGINLTAVRIDTSEPGLYGLGCATFAYRHLVVKCLVEEYLRPLLIGRPVENIEDLWHMMHQNGYWRNGPAENNAVSGVDMALWDIKGKMLGAPVYELLGGLVRDRMKMYSWVGGDRPADVIAGIRKLQAIGFNTFKLNGCEEMGLIDTSKTVDAAVAVVAEIRSAFGNEIEFGLDFHGRVAAPMARVLIKELEPYRPLFIEEPVLAEQAEYYPRLAEMTHIPIAAGERMFSRFEFKRVFAAGGISIVQPDLSHAGGITECVKIAAMAEAYDIGLAPHCPLGPLALASCLHVDFVSYNAVLQEQSMGIHYNQGAELMDYVLNKDDFRFHDGYMLPPTKPGLGVEVNEELVVERSRNAPDWRNPVWRHADGAVAEW